jgi:uncharacterized phage-associated protein
MENSKSYTHEQLDKLGNAMIFLTEKLGKIPKTKILKLLFILEEVSVSKHGIPFFNVPFEVWQFGPIPKEVFVQLSNFDETNYFSKYIQSVGDGNASFFTPNTHFNDDEFSDNDIQILELVIEKFGNLDCGALVKYTHRPGSLWHTFAEMNDLLEEFEKGTRTCSDVKIDFSYQLRGEDFKKYIYNQYQEFSELSV